MKLALIAILVDLLKGQMLHFQSLSFFAHQGGWISLKFIEEALGTNPQVQRNSTTMALRQIWWF